MRSVVMLSQTGCLLPSLILLNLFFGWMFFQPLAWLSLEGVLILLFIINFFILARRISSLPGKPNNVIDVKGEVVEEEKKTP